MIALSSSSIGYDYQLLFILYHGKSVIFCYNFLSLFVYCQQKKRLCCFGYIASAVFLVTGLSCTLIFKFSNAVS